MAPLAERHHHKGEIDAIATSVVLIIVGVAIAVLACYLYHRWRTMRRERLRLHLEAGALDFGSDEGDLVLDEDAGSYRQLTDMGAPSGLLSEVRGAGTGATEQRLGRFAVVHRGVGRLPAAVSDSLGRASVPPSPMGAPAGPGADGQVGAGLPAALFDTFTSELHRFSVAKPRGWRVEAAASTETTVLQLVCPRSASVYRRFSVAWDDVSWAATRPEKFARSMAAEMVRDIPGARVEAVEPFDGLLAHSSPSGAWAVRYSVSGAGGGAAGGAASTLRLITVVVMAGRGRARAEREHSWARAFSLSFAADAAAFPAYEPLGRALIDSFSLEPSVRSIEAAAWAVDAPGPAAASGPPSGYLPAHGAGFAADVEPLSLPGPASPAPGSDGAGRASAPIRAPQPRARPAGGAARPGAPGSSPPDEDEAARSWAAAAEMPDRAALLAPPSLPDLAERRFPAFRLAVRLPPSWARAAAEPAGAPARRLDASFVAGEDDALWAGCRASVTAVDRTRPVRGGKPLERVAAQWAAFYETAVSGSGSLARRTAAAEDGTSARFLVRSAAGPDVGACVAVTEAGLHRSGDSVFGHIVSVSGPAELEARVRELGEAVCDTIAPL